MSKFTIFTIILSISVITVTADLAARTYFKSDEAQTSVVTEGQDEASVLPPQPTPISEVVTAGTTTDVSPPADSQSFDVTDASSPGSQQQLPPSSTITQFLVTQAGFNGTLAEDHFNGKLFQLLDITKYPVEAISLYKIQQDGAPVATVTEIALRDEITALQLYVLLQNKTKPYIDLSLNETNAYGDRSFYINHAKKPDEAFLAVKIGKMIYAFAYVKAYHPQVKELIQLLTK